MLVNETIAQPLVHTRVSYKPNELRHQLREHFPRSEVTQNEHDRNACAKFPRHRLDIFDLDALEDFSGGICVSFALQSKFAPSRRKWQRTS